jgi:hypothetical protein
MTTSTTDKSLERFLEAIHTNQQHVRNNLSEHYSMIRHVDGCFVTLSAHLVNPNPHGLFLAMNIEAGDDKSTVLTTLALTGDANALRFAMKNVAYVGLTSLYIFQKIFYGEVRESRYSSENRCVGEHPLLIDTLAAHTTDTCPPVRNSYFWWRPVRQKSRITPSSGSRRLSGICDIDNHPIAIVALYSRGHRHP